MFFVDFSIFFSCSQLANRCPSLRVAAAMQRAVRYDGFVQISQLLFPFSSSDMNNSFGFGQGALISLIVDASIQITMNVV